MKVSLGEFQFLNGGKMEINEILTTIEAKRNFIEGLIRLAKVDGFIDEKEFAFFQQAAYGLGLNDDIVQEINTLRENDAKIVIKFNSNKEKLFFLIQAVQLCLIDGTYSDVEQKEIRDICKEINISYDSLTEIEKWAYEGIAWNKRGDELLNLK